MRHARHEADGLLAVEAADSALCHIHASPQLPPPQPLACQPQHASPHYQHATYALVLHFITIRLPPLPHLTLLCSSNRPPPVLEAYAIVLYLPDATCLATSVRCARLPQPHSYAKSTVHQSAYHGPMQQLNSHQAPPACPPPCCAAAPTHLLPAAQCGAAHSL